MAQRLKGKRTETRIHQLYRRHDHTPVTNPQVIANAFSDYYSDLYNLHKDPLTHQPSQEDINHFLHDLRLPTLTADQLTSLNTSFSEQEIQTTIRSLPTGKALGPDGLSDEYYRHFADHLAPQLVDVFNTASLAFQFPSDMLNALIITIPKPGKEPTTPQNFCTISLLNLDIITYYIYAKTIAARLLNIMPTLILGDQSGFTKGRQASDATRRVIDLINHA